MSFNGRILLALALFPLQIHSLLPQGEEPSQYIRLTSEAVILDVVVRDKKGNLIPDLAPGEFHVFENGEEQQILSVRFIDGSSPSEVPALSRDTQYLTSAPVSVLNQSHLISLVFDALDNDSRRYSRDAIRDLLKTDLPPDTYLGVFSIYHGLRALTPYTSDPDLIWTGVELATSGHFDEINNRSMALHQELIEVSQRLQDLVESGLAGPAIPTPGTGPVSTVEIARQSQRQVELALLINILDNAASVESTFEGHTVLDALQALVSAQRDLPGRKTVLYASEGLYIPEKLVFRLRNLISRSNISNVSIYSLDARGLTHLSQSRMGTDALQHAAAMSRSQVQSGGTGAVSAAEMRSLETAENSIRMNVQVTLEDLSRSTGGFLIANTNDPRREMEQLASELQSYYEIVYTPSLGSTNTDYRKITVEVDRPSVAVQSRDGYYPLPANTATLVKGWEAPLLASLNQTQTASAFPVRTRTLHFSQTTESVQQVLAANVPFETLEFRVDRETERYSGHLSVLALVKNSDGETLHKFSEDYPLEGPLAELEKVRQGDIVFMRLFDLPPGRYRVELAAYDHFSQKASTTRQVLVVPSPRQGLQISSILVIAGLEPLSYADKLMNSPLDLPEYRVIPYLKSEVNPGDDQSIGFFCAIYPDSEVSDPAGLTIAVFKDGQPLFKGTPQLEASGENGQLSSMFTIPTADLGGGTYELRVWAEQGSQSVSESTLFTLR